jgi:hypothetical protein
MPLLVPDEGEVRMLDMLVNGDTFTDVRLRLYKNNLTPDQDTVYIDLDEATFPGYAEQTPSFGAASIVSHKGKIVDTSARSFVWSGSASPENIYGYYVVDIGTFAVLWVQRFSSPQVMSSNGDTITITAALTANSE